MDLREKRRRQAFSYSINTEHNQIVLTDEYAQEIYEVLANAGTQVSPPFPAGSSGVMIIEIRYEEDIEKVTKSLESWKQPPLNEYSPSET